MAPEIIYLFKVNVAIALFYAFYRLLFHKDTFFQWRRIALLSFLALSLVYPLMNIQDWIKSQEPMVAMTDIYASVILPEVEIMPANEISEVSWHKIILSSIGYIYLGVCLILLIRVISQLFILLRMVHRTRTGYIGNSKVHLLTGPEAPFSFFKWIFINPEVHTEEEISEILTHEQTHARQWHSIDVLFSELICILCWFNPFMWLLKREIRGNLEYLADNKVLEKGYDSKTYQYHLLGLAHQTKVATLYNNFNVLPLKNRIKMMNKKRTKKIETTKYFLFPLLAAALLIVSNIDAIARTTGAVIDEITASAMPVEAPQLEMTEAEMDVDQQDPVFEIVENMPEFPGGTEAMLKFLNDNIVYPEVAKKNKIQGRVIVQFVVSKEGKVTNPKIARSVEANLDAEALRVIGLLPTWKPGQQRGQNVAVKFTVPVVFRLGDKGETAPPPQPLPKKGEPNANGVFEIVENMPEFPGGQEALMRFLADGINYPADAKEKQVQGRVIVQFVVQADGSVTDPRIVRSVFPSLDEEAIRVVKTLPKWKAGMQRGVAVPTKFTVPVQFRL